MKSPDDREKILSALNLMKGATGITLNESGQIASSSASECQITLRPVRLPICESDVQLITKWRNEHRQSFFTWFTATEDRTRKWLYEKIIPTEDRILFMIEAQARVFGHIGLTNFDFSAKSCEIDNVLRGRGNMARGGMTLALRGILVWLRTLHMDSAHLRVFSDNMPAINLYNRCGFVIVKDVPMIRIDDTTSIRWVEAQGSVEDRNARHATHMVVHFNKLPQHVTK
jgi:RimJ/RimL family protein N-acetyltransferase